MRTIIAGPRTVHDYAALLQAIDEAVEAGIYPTVVLSGGAAGVDRMGERWARSKGLPVELHRARWNDLSAPGAVIKKRPGFGKRYNARAGLDRNARMADVADALIALWDGHSSGTRHMISLMSRAHKPFHVHSLLL